MDIISAIRSCDLAAYGLEEDLLAELLPYWRELCRRDDLLALAQQYHDGIFENHCYSGVTIQQLPEQDGREQGLLFAMLSLARYDHMGQVLAQRGIPEEYRAGGLFVLKGNLRKNVNYYGTVGLCGMYRSGAVEYLMPNKIILGRLSFEMTTFQWPFVVYRNRRDGSLLPLARGARYLPDGTRAPQAYTGEVLEPQLIQTDTEIIGCTFDEKGHLLPTPLRLCAAEYERVLGAEDPILSVHIPANGRLTQESVDDAFAQAEKFFSQYYPEKQFKAYICSSWLLETHLRTLLPPDSNILQFQKRFRIILSGVNWYSIYWHVFDVEKFVPYGELTPKNSFQKTLLDWVSGGGVMHNGCGFILR